MATKIEVRLDQPYTLVIDTGLNLTGATEPKALDRDPTGATGEVVGTITDLEDITVAIAGSLNAIAGEWVFQASALFPGDTDATTGQPFSVISRGLWQRPGV